MIQWYDLTVLAVLAVPVPILAAWGYRQFRRELAAGLPDVRIRAYRQTIVIEWCAAVVVLALWLYAQRPLSQLGLGFPSDWRAWLAMGLAVAGAALLVGQTISVRNSAKARESLRRQLLHVEELVPHTERELATFRAVSVTAGICEELVFRGYVMWLLDAIGGPWLAVPGSVVLFSLGHLYQGPRSLGGVLIVGLATAGLYLLAGALWAPMLLHVAIDLSSGSSSLAAFGSEAADPEEAGVPGAD